MTSYQSLSLNCPTPQAEMMEESEDEIKRRQELLGMYDACKDALKTISEVTAKTNSTPMPAAVANNHHA